MPRKSVVRLTDRPVMTLGVYRRYKTTMQQQQKSLTQFLYKLISLAFECTFISANHIIYDIEYFKQTGKSYSHLS